MSDKEKDLTPIGDTLADAAQSLFVSGHLPDAWFDDNIKKHWKLEESVGEKVEG